MDIRPINRRRALQIVGLGLVGTLPGCDKREAAHAVGEAMISIGAVVLTIPHLLGKIIGAALVGGGSILKVYITLSDGGNDEVDLSLTPEQMEILRKAAARGQKAKVVQPDGSKTEINVQK